MPEQTDAEHGEQVRARLAAATPGPWCAADEHGDLKGAKPSWCVSRMTKAGEYVTDVAYIPQDMAIPEGQPCPQEQADADLIANAPADLTRLLARAERAEREREEARRHVNTLVSELRVWQRQHVDKVAEVVRVEDQPEPTAEPRHALTCDHLTGKGLRECKPGCPAYTPDPYLRGADA